MQHHVTATGATNEHDQPASAEVRIRRFGRCFGFLFGLGIILAATACTPEQFAFVAAVSEPYEHVLTGAQLAALRRCESGGDYTIVDHAGTFRGAYQFNRSTWDGVAARHFEWLVGVDPAEADPWWQDVMARALYSERGRAPWPVCGRRL